MNARYLSFVIMFDIVHCWWPILRPRSDVEKDSSVQNITLCSSVTDVSEEIAPFEKSVSVPESKGFVSTSPYRNTSNC
jgi:hypothetical protein